MKTYIEKAIKADVTQQNAIDRAHGKAVATLFGMLAHVTDKSDIKEYCDGWAEAMKQIGRPDSSVKVEKSARKLIIEFATGNKKDCEVEREQAVNLINQFHANGSNSIMQLAQDVRDYLKGEPDEDNDQFDFAAQLAKLITKAEEAGVDRETIRKVVIEQLIPSDEDSE